MSALWVLASLPLLFPLLLCVAFAHVWSACTVPLWAVGPGSRGPEQDWFSCCGSREEACGLVLRPRPGRGRLPRALWAAWGPQCALGKGVQDPANGCLTFPRGRGSLERSSASGKVPFPGRGAAGVRL